MSEDKKIWELKETAKWASNTEEKKNAISGLTSYGEEALLPLTEIQVVTAYEEIRAACADAIRKIAEAKQSGKPKKS